MALLKLIDKCVQPVQVIIVPGLVPVRSHRDNMGDQRTVQLLDI
jgi:hypothetical protein